MALTRRAELVATSRADDLALRALADVAAITRDEDARIVGGHMVALLITAFPAAGLAGRRTNDADAAITVELAGSGILHERLTTIGYTATAGNSYGRVIPELATELDPEPTLSVDLLVPSLDGRFRPTRLGERAFDAAPGLAPALAAEPIVIDAGITLLDGSVREFPVSVPTVEFALVIKAIAYGSRGEYRDVEDIYCLLEIAASHDPVEIGGWNLDGNGLTGARGDAATHLHSLARASRRLRGGDVPIPRLAALIAERVGKRR
jgi:hypothetical protein